MSCITKSKTVQEISPDAAARIWKRVSNWSADREKRTSNPAYATIRQTADAMHRVCSFAAKNGSSVVSLARDGYGHGKKWAKFVAKAMSW